MIQLLGIIIYHDQNKIPVLKFDLYFKSTDGVSIIEDSAQIILWY